MANKALAKIFYASIGLAALAAEQLQKNITQLIIQGKISEEEGKKIVDNLRKTSEAQKDKLEDALLKITDNILKKFDFLSKEEVNEIQNQINQLETNNMHPNSIKNTPNPTAATQQHTNLNTQTTKVKKIKIDLTN